MVREEEGKVKVVEEEVEMVEEEVEGVIKVRVEVVIVVVGEDKRNNKSNFLIFVYMFYSTSCTGTYHIVSTTRIFYCFYSLFCPYAMLPRYVSTFIIYMYTLFIRL